MLELLESPGVTLVGDDCGSGASLDGLTLHDCLKTFTMEETLSGADMWYCNKCKDHVQATKKMEVYKTPEILIIHLKRFSHNRASVFGSRKL